MTVANILAVLFYAYLICSILIMRYFCLTFILLCFFCGVILDCTPIWYSDLFAEYCKDSHTPEEGSLLGIPLYLWDTLVEIHPIYLIDFNVEIHPNYLINMDLIT